MASIPSKNISEDCNDTNSHIAHDRTSLKNNPDINNETCLPSTKTDSSEDLSLSLKSNISESKERIQGNAEELELGGNQDKCNISEAAKSEKLVLNSAVSTIVEENCNPSINDKNITKSSLVDGTSSSIELSSDSLQVCSNDKPNLEDSAPCEKLENSGILTNTDNSRSSFQIVNVSNTLKENYASSQSCIQLDKESISKKTVDNTIQKIANTSALEETHDDDICCLNELSSSDFKCNSSSDIKVENELNEQKKVGSLNSESSMKPVEMSPDDIKIGHKSEIVCLKNNSSNSNQKIKENSSKEFIQTPELLDEYTCKKVNSCNTPSLEAKLSQESINNPESKTGKLSNSTRSIGETTLQSKGYGKEDCNEACAAKPSQANCNPETERFNEEVPQDNSILREFIHLSNEELSKKSMNGNIALVEHSIKKANTPERNESSLSEELSDNNAISCLNKKNILVSNSSDLKSGKSSDPKVENCSDNQMNIELSASKGQDNVAALSSDGDDKSEITFIKTNSYSSTQKVDFVESKEKSSEHFVHTPDLMEGSACQKENSCNASNLVTKLSQKSINTPENKTGKPIVDESLLSKETVNNSACLNERIILQSKGDRKNDSDVICAAKPIREGNCENLEGVIGGIPKKCNSNELIKVSNREVDKISTNDNLTLIPQSNTETNLSTSSKSDDKNDLSPQKDTMESANQLKIQQKNTLANESKTDKSNINDAIEAIYSGETSYSNDGNPTSNSSISAGSMSSKNIDEANKSESSIGIESCNPSSKFVLYLDKDIKSTLASVNDPNTEVQSLDTSKQCDLKIVSVQSLSSVTTTSCSSDATSEEQEKFINERNDNAPTNICVTNSEQKRNDTQTVSTTVNKNNSEANLVSVKSEVCPLPPSPDVLEDNSLDDCEITEMVENQLCEPNGTNENSKTSKVLFLKVKHFAKKGAGLVKKHSSAKTAFIKADVSKQALVIDSSTRNDTSSDNLVQDCALQKSHKSKGKANKSPIKINPIGLFRKEDACSSKSNYCSNQLDDKMSSTVKRKRDLNETTIHLPSENSLKRQKCSSDDDDDDDIKEELIVEEGYDFSVIKQENSVSTKEKIHSPLPSEDEEIIVDDDLPIESDSQISQPIKAKPSRKWNISKKTSLLIKRRQKSKLKLPTKSKRWRYKEELELPEYLQKLAQHDPSIVSTVERVTSLGKRINVKTLVFPDKILNWVLKETYLSSLESSRILRMKLGMHSKSKCIYNNKPIDDAYPLALGEVFPFTMPDLKGSTAIPGDDVIPLPISLQHLTNFCPSITSCKTKEVQGQSVSFNAVNFAEEPLEWALKETLLSSFTDSPILTDLLGLSNEEEKFWPEMAGEIFNHVRTDHTFPFSCLSKGRRHACVYLFFRTPKPHISPLLMEPGIKLPPLPLSISKRYDDARDCLLRLLSLASYYYYLSNLPSISSDESLSIIFSSVVNSFRPLIISQANEIGELVFEMRKILLMDFVSNDASIIPALINGAFSMSKSFFGNVEVLEKSVALDNSNVLRLKTNV